ncbi:hypothetical protein IscW_ISCW002521 [Ixodes scapularis]|uniref:Uncharacterized protein n=1 Tax=Ixodes scapularis TaxID=6945 RepID=B7P9D7_IXOSC|nr:hypothetical protein IscW_ISCW002521 [Ixodes scapularis]|eukprot:XP_002404021.1 hypothetical protein IscW_ISCW002521 [Ixodes scapularis]
MTHGNRRPPCIPGREKRSPGVLARDERRTIPVHRHGRAGRLARSRHCDPGSERGDSAEEQRPEQTEAWMQRPLITVRQESRAAEGKEARRLSDQASAAAERGPEPCRRLQARAGGH